MTYKEIIDLIKDTCNDNFFINDFSYGNISDINTPDDEQPVNYPYAFLNPISLNQTEQFATLNANLIIMTQTYESLESEIQGQSFCINHLNQILSTLKMNLDNPLVDFNFPLTITPFKERFSDNVVGATANISVTFPYGLDDCETPFDKYPVAFTLTGFTGDDAFANGTYRFLEDNIEISTDAGPEFECKTFTDLVPYIKTPTDPTDGDVMWARVEVTQLLFNAKGVTPISYSGCGTTYTGLDVSMAYNYIVDPNNMFTSFNGRYFIKEGTFGPVGSNNDYITINHLNVLPTPLCPSPSATPSVTPTITPTTTPSVTPSITPTITTTPSVTTIPSITTTPTITPTTTITPTPSITPTTSITPTNSVTPTITITPTITPTTTITPTSTITPTITPTTSVTPTPTPSSSVPSGDPDANAFLADVIASGGTTNATISAATETLFTSLKSAGLYSKMYAMYPFVGGTAASHSINALLNKSYDITWNGGMTHGVSGSTGNGTNAYGNTNWNYHNWGQDDISCGVYQITENTSTKTEELQLGIFDGTPFRLQIQLNNTQLATGKYGLRTGSNTATYVDNNGNINGNYILNRTGSTVGYLYRNSSLVVTNTASYTKPVSGNKDVFLFTLNLNGSPYSNAYANQTLSFSFMAQGLSNTEITTLDGIINDFQTALGRNTYFSVSDPDAQTYLNDVVDAGGTIDETTADATNTLFTSLKSNGLYNDLYFFPFVGGTSASHSLFAKRSAGTTYDITWFGGMTHGVSGATGNGTNSYGETALQRPTYSNQGDLTQGIYVVGDSSNTNAYELQSTVTDNNVLITRYTTSLAYVRYNGGFKTASNSDGTGLYIATLTGSTGGVAKLFKNTSTTLINSTISNDNDYLAHNNWILRGPALTSSSPRTVNFVLYSTYLTDSQASTLSTIINTFQTSLGRNIYT